jgi:hypothetical protein
MLIDPCFNMATLEQHIIALLPASPNLGRTGQQPALVKQSSRVDTEPSSCSPGCGNKPRSVLRAFTEYAQILPVQDQRSMLAAPERCPCRGAKKLPNPALNRLKPENFAPRVLAHLVPGVLPRLEAQLGAGEESLASSGRQREN